MKIKLTNYFATSLRFKLAENLAVQKLRGILTTRYPPEVLNTEFFEDMAEEEKLFIKKYWTTFDVFKPVFEVVGEIPKYQGFILYEVTSSLNKKNIGIDKKQTIRLSTNQKNFFDECEDKDIPVKIFYVTFLDDWEIECKILDYGDVDIYIRPPSAWNEERIKRIKSSKLNQFWHDLFPSHVLERVNEDDLNKEEKKRFNEYIKEKTSTPLMNYEKEMLIRRAIKRNKKIPKFLENDKQNLQESTLRSEQINKRVDYRERLNEIKNKYPNAYEPWKKEEDEKLQKLFSNSKSVIEISTILKRQPSAIQSRLKKLNLTSL